MSLGLRLLAHLSSPVSEPSAFLSGVEGWLNRNYAFMRPKLFRTEIDSSPALLCTLHPAAEDLELVLIQPDQLLVSANTTTVGPGYHMFLVSLLKDLTKTIGASWERSQNE